MGQLAGPRGEPGHLSKGAFVSFISCSLNHAISPQWKSSEQGNGETLLLAPSSSSICCVAVQKFPPLSGLTFST